MYDELKLETTYIPHIRSQIQNGSLVLFTGAGFSLDGFNTLNERVPGVWELCKQIWEICYPGEEIENDTELQDIFEDAYNRHAVRLGALLKSKFSINAKQCPEWYRQLLRVPWLRAYTLNIDDLIEKIVDDLSLSRSSNSVSALTDNITKLSDQKLNVIHLNGVLKDSPNDITFSTTQYAERLDKDPYYQQLTADLIARPVVFIGSKLSEGPLWEHIVSRGSKGIRGVSELRPRSYLVIPTLHRSKQAMLAAYNITWLPMTGEEFCEKVISPQKDCFNQGFDSLKSRGGVEYSRRFDFSFVSNFLQEKDVDTEYLLGNEPVWSDIKKAKVAKREIFEDIYKRAGSIRASASSSQFIVVTGTAGTGKSSALMVLASRLHADGLNIAWLDSSYKYSKREFSIALQSVKQLDALLINDADIYNGLASWMIKTAIEYFPHLLVVVETRSNKVDRTILKYELGKITPIEITMPSLTDNDIHSILDVLDRENRLGILKGSSRQNQFDSFKKSSKRQLIVAMYEATSGKRFEEKVSDELAGLDSTAQLIYGLIAAATARRYSLTRDEVLIGVGDTSNETLNILDTLLRRKIISRHGTDYLKARHRIISEIVFNSLVNNGKFARVLKGMLMLSATKVTERSLPNARTSRIMKTFINHNFIKKVVDIEDARNIYGEFEGALNWNPHYWLHRGALELEVNNLDLAENFLNQAMNSNSDDLYIQTEWAYLQFKKALKKPKEIQSKDLITNAIDMLHGIIARRINLSAHAYHILGSNCLKWSKVGIADDEDRHVFLSEIKSHLKQALNYHPGDKILSELHENIAREILILAI